MKQALLNILIYGVPATIAYVVGYTSIRIHDGPVWAADGFGMLASLITATAWILYDKLSVIRDHQTNQQTPKP
jgi:hypothetical protein